MKSSGRIPSMVVLPLLLFASACTTTDPVVNIEEPNEVDSCEWLVPIGIELVNDYVYTLVETDLGTTGGDPELLPTEIVSLNLRGAELDARVAELGCDAVALNKTIADATAGIETDDPVIAVFLDSVRGGIVAPVVPTRGEWVLESGSVAGGILTPLPDHPIVLTIEVDAASGFAGCNGYYYPVMLADGLWTWAEGSAEITALLCTDDVGEDETEVVALEASYLRALETVAAYSLEGEALVLRGDGVVLRFVRSAGD